MMYNKNHFSKETRKHRKFNRNRKWIRMNNK